jgi:CMP-N,N'-diacetyllegionaminic acid synthase
MATICVIGARGGSKGVPSKNIRLLLGKPLIGYSIEQAKACPEIDRVFVSTDSPAIAEVAKSFGAEVPFVRPPEISNDTAGKWGVWQHALGEINRLMNGGVDLYVDLDCTNPLRDTTDISKAIAQFKTAKVDAVFSVCEARKNPYFNMLERDEQGFMRICKSLAKPIVRRQDAPEVLEHVASIYVLSPEYIRRGTGLLSGRTQGYNIGADKSYDIDSENDFQLIEYLMSKKLKKT